jgi:hypothetical protein
MADFTVDSMQLIITLGKIKPNKKYVYPSLVIPVQIRSNSLRTSPASPQDDHRQIGIVFTNMLMKVSVTGKVENGENIVIGYARPEPLQSEIKGSVNNIDFILVLDHYILSQVEKFRKCDNLYLEADLRAQGYTIEKGEFHEHELNRERVTVHKSNWVEEILPELNYKHVTLIEVPVLESKDFVDVIAEVDEAWRQYSMGDYKQVLTHCRSALDGIATKIREAGFKMKEEEEFLCQQCGQVSTKSSNNKEKGKRTVPDWKAFFGDDKIAHSIKEIYRNTRAYTVPGTHFGKTFGMDEANFVLFQTYSIVKYILSRFEELKS